MPVQRIPCTHAYPQLLLCGCSGLERLRIEAIAGQLCSVLPDGIGRLARLRSLQLPNCSASKAGSLLPSVAFPPVHLHVAPSPNTSGGF